jgi:hypothetical protein
LSNARVQDAQASVEKDRIAILERVEASPGFAILNNRVNELLREWIRNAILDMMETTKETSSAGDDNNTHTHCCAKKLAICSFIEENTIVPKCCIAGV